MHGCLACLACTDVSLAGMREQLEEDFSHQVAEQTLDLQEQLSNRSLQEQGLRGELLELTAHWEEEKEREREAFQEQLEGMQREMEGMRRYYEAQMEEREAEIDRDLTDTRFSYECEISVLRQQLVEQGCTDEHDVEMSGGPTDQYDVEMSGPPNDQCGDYGLDGRTDLFENGSVSESVLGIVSDITGHDDQFIVGGTEDEINDIVEYEGSDCSHANISSQFGLGRGNDDIVEYEASDCSHVNISSDALGCSPDIGSDSSSVQELVGSDFESGDLQMEMQGCHDQMEHFREDSDREHLAAMSRLCAELSENQHKTQLELETVKSQAAQETEIVKCQAAQELETVKYQAAQEIETVKCQAAQEIETVKCQAAQEIETVKAQAAQEIETVKAQAAQEMETVKTQAAQELETVKSEAAQEIETVKSEAAQKLETVKSEAAQEIETVKSEAAQEIETVKYEAAQEIETVKSEAAQELETVKSEAAQELETVKSQAAQEIETVKSEAAQAIETVKAQAAQEMETVKTQAAQELETVKSQAAQEIETVKSEAAQEIETVKSEAAQEIETVKSEAVQEIETVKSESAQELETVKSEAAQELETVKSQAAQEIETVKSEAAQAIETVNSEAAQELETVKSQAAQELETMKSQAAEEIETVKSQAIDDEQDLRREIRHSFVAQLEEMRSEMLTQQNEEMENWKNTAHSRDSRSGDHGLRSRSPTDGELIRTETGPKVATVGENIGSVMLRELQEGFESRTKIMEERHLMKLDECQKEIDRLCGVKDEVERSRDELLEKMRADAGGNESVAADGPSPGQVREMTALTEACCKLKAMLVECSSQIEAYWHVTDIPGEKEAGISGDTICRGGTDKKQTESSTCQLDCVTDVIRAMLHVSRDVDSLTHSISAQGW